MEVDRTDMHTSSQLKSIPILCSLVAIVLIGGGQFSTALLADDKQVWPDDPFATPKANANPRSSKSRRPGAVSAKFDSPTTSPPAKTPAEVTVDYEEYDYQEFVDGDDAGYVIPPNFGAPSTSVFQSGADCNCYECNPVAHLNCTTPDCSCGLRPRSCGLWVGAEYLLWSLQGTELPALVTASPAGTLPSDTGVLGLASTSTLLSGTQGEEFRSGGRITVGLWTDRSHRTAWEASYLGIDDSNDSFSVSSSSQPNLARPVFDTLLGGEASMLIAHQNFLSGSIAVDSSTQLQAFEILRRRQYCSDGFLTFDFLIGFKHGSLDDLLRVRHASNYFQAQGPISAGTATHGFDNFEAKNDFNGLLLGIERRHHWNRWKIAYTGKVSLGSNNVDMLIDGQTITTVPGGGTSTFNGGLLAQATNIGTYSRNEFVAIPEFKFSAQRQINQCLGLQCGYNIMYWSSAVRAADAVSRRVSQFPPEAVTGTGDPKFAWTSSGFLAHGFQFGLNYQF
ncbi:BBP7 family outer membrane beta-barrel protein [Aureliella helgolandensis]|uniref:Uncharacterized protein n=1 Tax=Aureliella helgolandensis TaxID=2527968 RepID=A0A518G3E9_9BACT|nr:BBP7 family outer membrane beta-barrel protein [Aureliella helgolandensis]QDV23126.1 hypothetical protein Q31a_14220 [Aureliella helgolandensis]